MRAALAADEPPKYGRGPRGSKLDVVEPRIRSLLAEFPDMAASVIAEQIGWERSSSILRVRVRVAALRPLYRPAGPG